MPRFGRTGTGVGVGDGVASTAPAGKDSETTSAGIKKALETNRLKDDIYLKINGRLPITWLAHRKTEERINPADRTRRAASCDRQPLGDHPRAKQSLGMPVCSLNLRD